MTHVIKILIYHLYDLLAMSVEIRGVRPEDRKDLIRLFSSLSEDTKKALNGSGFGFKEAREFADSAFDSLTRSFLLLVNGNLVGEGRYVYLLPGLKVLAEIGIVITDEYQGKGYGKLLLSRILEDGIRNGVRKFLLYVDSSNKKAINLFRDFGFEISEIVIDEDRTLYFMTRYISRDEIIDFALPKAVSVSVHPGT